MAAETLDILPPIGGVHRGVGYQSAAPYFYDDGENYWPSDVFEKRERGGSRPGLVRTFNAAVTGPIHLLSNVRAVETTGETTFTEDFNAQLGQQWSPATYLSSRMPLVYPVWGIAVVHSQSSNSHPDGASQLQDLAPSTAAGTKIKASLRILNDSDNVNNPNLYSQSTGLFYIWGRLDNTTPSKRSSVFALANFNVTAPYLTLGFINANGASEPGVGSTTYLQQQNVFPATLSLEMTAAGVCKLMWEPSDGRNAEIQANDPSAVDISTRRRFAFHIYGPHESTGAPRFIRADWFTVRYSGDPPAPNRNIVVVAGGTSASAAGKVHILYEDTPGDLVAPATNALTNPKARQLQATELLGDLYIVGEDAEGIWKFNPDSTGALTELINVAFDSVSAGAGTKNSILIAAWRSRLCVVSRDDPHNIAMSKIGDPTNWTYTALPVGSAVRLNTTGIDSGKIGEPINALIAHSDDQLLIGCLHSMYVLRGDPTYGGQIDRLSSSIGIVAPQAWARGPNGETILLSSDGIYGIAPGISGYPTSISRELLPQELRDIDVNNNRILMAYDVRNRGVFIGVTPILGGGSGTYWWFDWQKKGFHLMSFNSSHEPTALAYRTADSPLDQRLILGCRDGQIRHMDDRAFSDDGVPFTPQVLIGPVALGSTGYEEGMILEVIGELAEGSAAVNGEVWVGRSIENARKSPRKYSFTLRSGKNRTFNPRLSGNASYIRLSGAPPWSLEKLCIVRERLGKQLL